MKNRPRVAFQGERGAFSEEAAERLLGPEIEMAPQPTFEELFRVLADGLADYAVAPVENGLVGSVQACIELLNQSPFLIRDEVTIPIAQHLIGCKGTSIMKIETVESHPVALAQCALFFAAHPRLKKIEADDTAASVARIVRAGNPKRAAIAGRRAAERYGGMIIEENIQDHFENHTRFVLLSRPQEASTGLRRWLPGRATSSRPPIELKLKKPIL